MVEQKNNNENQLEARKSELTAKLQRHEAKTKASNRRTQNDGAGFAQAMRLSTEFVVGILVGAAIGWGIDYLCGTKPWAMIIFLLLGFCAGVLNVLRAANLIADVGQNQRNSDKDADFGGNA